MNNATKPYIQHNNNWQIKTFDQLSNYNLYQILELRQAVFVIEQNAQYNDLDFLDQKALHIYLEHEGKPVAYARALPENTRFTQASIGRVIVAASHRRTGLGTELIQQTITAMKDHYHCQEIIISAQTHLQQFYGQFGFVTTSEPYLDAGIPHCQMVMSEK